GTGGASPEVASGPPAGDAGGPPSTPQRPTDPTTRGRVVRAPPSLRPAPPERRPAGHAAGPLPWPALPAGAARHHGRGLPPVRPPLPHRHGAVQLVPTAPAGAPFPQPGQEPGQVALAQPGEGADVPGRQAVAGDFQRGGARQPSLPQDAENHLPSPDASRHQGAAGAGSATGSPNRGPLRHDPLPSPNTRITPKRQLPCYRVSKRVNTARGYGIRQTAEGRVARAFSDTKSDTATPSSDTWYPTGRPWMGPLRTTWYPARSRM